ncbi:MAG TPA: CheR family methyltransferase [Thermomicrobiales bacterium]|jgi:two-component system CheB/CheR fusion protein
MLGGEALAQRNTRRLVVIGSSAGGIDALSTLVATLPADFPAPIVIAQHLDPRRYSSLHEILARHTPLPVRRVDEHTTIEEGVIYVIPAHRHVIITTTEIDVRVDGAGRPMPSINLLLDTAAAVYGEQLIAVILTGLGSDGTIGAHSVQKAGGTVIIQNPATAAHPAMPRSLAPSTVDIVADLARIGPILYDLLNGSDVPTRPDDDRALATFLEQIREQHGIDFSSYKSPTIRRRLQRRIIATNARDLPGYLDYLDQHPEEYQQLISSFLIKVTQFFRDPELYAYLRATILPELIARAERRERELRIWSAGCATGEEAYSLAILVAEILGHDLRNWRIRIFSTDLDPEAINFARQGTYSPTAVAGMPDDLLERCFSSEDGVYQVRKHIRALTVFGQHDLGQRAPFPWVDLVVCRNVLIYFTQELQHRALHLFAYSLREHGVLVLGKAESTSQLSEYFRLEHSQFRIYRRQGERILMPTARVHFPAFTTPPMQLADPARRLPGGPHPRRTSREARLVGADERHLLQLPIGIVVVDRRYDIQAINTIARQLLEIYAAAIGDDLIHVAQRVPHALLREAIDRTFRSGMPTSLEPFAIHEALTDTQRSIQITCYPQRAEGSNTPLELVVVMINDLTEALGARSTAGDMSDAEIADATPEARLQRQEQLIERLTATNRQLVAANRELLSTNEELRTTNEELVLSVEEAQASTEEIETLNEEMQATNEELETLNEELQATVEELNTTNDELHARTDELLQLAQTSEEARVRLTAILNTMGDALLVLNRDGTTLLMNDAYERQFSDIGTRFVAADVRGLPLTQQDAPQIRAMHGESFRMEFTINLTDGGVQWFEAIGQPVTDPEGALRWTILVIRDITDRSLHRLQEQFLSLASHELRTPLTSLRGYLQMLQRQKRTGEPNERVERYTANALGQVDRLDRLVNDLVDVVRLQHAKYTLDRRPLDLAVLAEHVVETAQALTAQPIHLTRPDAPVLIQADAGRIEQVLLNLLNNAVTHAPDSPQILVAVRQIDRVAEVRVQDTGPGIPPEALATIFSRFQQVTGGDRQASRGLGLGLFISRELVIAHGGTLNVESAVGQGSTFILRLPLEG